MVIARLDNMGKAKNNYIVGEIGAIICNKCKQWLSIDQFHKTKRNLGYKFTCKSCTSNGAGLRKRLKERSLGFDEYQFALSQGKCKICNKDFIDKEQIDHDHTTAIPRGLLCKKCNLGLGLFYDNADYILNAFKYLNSNSSIKEEFKTHNSKISLQSIEDSLYGIDFLDR